MKVLTAVEMTRVTPPEKRSQFAYDIWRGRKAWGADSWSEVARQILFIHQTLGLKAA